MKRKRVTIVLLLVLCLLLTACGAEEEKTPDFRNAYWGMSPNQVAKTEEREYLYADDTLLYYDGTWEDQPIEIYYEFEDGKLVRGECRAIIDEYQPFMGYIEKHHAFLEDLTQMYGPPKEEDYHVWKSQEDYNTYHLDAENFPMFYGVLTFFSSWEDEQTQRRLTMDYENLTINLVYYAEKKVESE